LFGENEKICPQNKGKSISEHLKSKFFQGACPRNPQAAWALWVCIYPLGVMPVTTTATGEQTSIENPE